MGLLYFWGHKWFICFRTKHCSEFLSVSLIGFVMSRWWIRSKVMNARMRQFYDMKSNLYNVFILKCVLIKKYEYRTTWRMLLDNKKNNTSRKRKTNILWIIALSSFSILHAKILCTTRKMKETAELVTFTEEILN